MKKKMQNRKTGSFGPQSAAKHIYQTPGTFKLLFNNKSVQLILEETNDQLGIKDIHESVMSMRGKQRTLFNGVRNMLRTLNNLPNS
jgi:hypothetical protein